MKKMIAIAALAVATMGLALAEKKAPPAPDPCQYTWDGQLLGCLAPPVR